MKQTTNFLLSALFFLSFISNTYPEEATKEITEADLKKLYYLEVKESRERIKYIDSIIERYGSQGEIKDFISASYEVKASENETSMINSLPIAKEEFIIFFESLENFKDDTNLLENNLKELPFSKETFSPMLLDVVLARDKLDESLKEFNKAQKIILDR